ncbi:MAG: HD domain-containing protein [archaeon]
MQLIKEPIHGLISLDELQESLIDLPEIQRLSWIKQLGLGSLVYPGAQHTRFEHSLGVSYVAGMFADCLKLDKHEKYLVEAAGLLHDIGHTPFSHVLETLLPKDHMELTEDLIVGKEVYPFPNAGKIPEILEKFGLNPKEVAALINRKYSKNEYLQQIIHSEIDADQLDYLCRDSHYTGARYGAVDVERIIKTSVIRDNVLCFLEKGIEAIEDVLVARHHMYKAVYIHKTVRIADMMLLKAAQSCMDEIPDFYYYTDYELLMKLKNSKNDFAREMVTRILFRQLYKPAYLLQPIAEKIDILKKLVELGAQKIEDILCEKTGLKKGKIIVDLPVEVLKISEPRLKKVNLKIITKEDEIVDLYDISQIARALSQVEGSKYAFSVYCVPEYRELVGNECRKFVEKI